MIGFVEANIGDFHERKLESLKKLKLIGILKRKNPYLFKAKNILTAQDLVKGLMDAHLSSQEETIFGEFLEELAIFACSTVFGADMNFFGVIAFALEKHRAGTWSPDEKIADPDWGRLLGLTEAEYDEFLNSSFSQLQAGHREWHERILREFSPLTNEEIALPSRFWEKDRFPIRFRLGRFASHMRQHTVQIEKTLSAICGPPNESRRLIRMLYAALAGVDTATLGAPTLGLGARQSLAHTIAARAAEITEALVSETVH